MDTVSPRPGQLSLKFGNWRMIKLLTQREASALLRLSERTLERFRLTGLGPVFVKAGRRVLYRESDLEVWVASRVRGSTSESQEKKTSETLEKHSTPRRSIK